MSQKMQYNVIDKTYKIKKSFNFFSERKVPGIRDEVTSEVMRFHERLVVEVGDYSVLDIATNIEHLKRET